MNVHADNLIGKLRSRGVEVALRLLASDIPEDRVGSPNGSVRIAG